MRTYSLFNEYVEGDYTYSVDMVKLNLVSYYSSGKYMLQRITDYIGDNFTRLEYTYRFSSSPWHYAYFWEITMGESIVKLWIGWNGTGRVDYKLGMIQFNPNKVCVDEKFNDFYRFLSCCCLEIKLKSWDFSLDIPYNRKKFKLHKDRRMYKRIEDGSLSESLGVNGDIGYFKLYDKRLESHMDRDLTRCELTLDNISCYEEMKDKFPDVDIYIKQIDISASLELSQNDFTFLRLLLSSDDFDYYYNQLTYRKREKFKPYLFQGELKVVPSKKGYKHCCEFVYSFLKFRGIRRYSNYNVNDSGNRVSKHFRIKKIPEKMLIKTKELSIDEVEKLFGIKE